MPGWKSPIKGCNKFSELPENAQKYVLKTEELLGVPGKMKKKLLLSGLYYACVFELCRRP
jgi:hypothetical protein